jgi:recombination protein RecT
MTDILVKIAEEVAPRVQKIQPKGFNIHRVTASIALEAARNPLVLKCTRESIARAIITVAHLGLDPADDSIYFIPFFNSKKSEKEKQKIYDLQVLIGYKGLVRLAMEPDESGNRYVRMVDAHLVHSEEEFSLIRDERGDHLVHKVSGRGDVIGVYARVFTPDLTLIEFLTKEEVEKVRSLSRARESSPWVEFWGEMAKKTALRRALKRLPKGRKAEIAMRLDEAVEMGYEVPIEEVTERGSEMEEKAQSESEQPSALQGQVEAPEVSVEQERNLEPSVVSERLPDGSQGLPGRRRRGRPRKEESLLFNEETEEDNHEIF